jgi:hypothetical protein
VNECADVHGTTGQAELLLSGGALLNEEQPE